VIAVTKRKQLTNDNGASRERSRLDKQDKGMIPKRDSVIFIVDDAEIERGSLPKSRYYAFKFKEPRKFVSCVSYSVFLKTPLAALAETVILDGTKLFEDIPWNAVASEEVMKNRRSLKKALQELRDDESFREDGRRSVIMLCLNSSPASDFQELKELGLLDGIKEATRGGTDRELVLECDKIDKQREGK
jgi:hypothetical protein